MVVFKSFNEGHAVPVGQLQIEDAGRNRPLDL